MPLEHLQQLFEQVGETAQRLAQLRATTGSLVLGGRVAESESVATVDDLKRQLGAPVLNATLAAGEVSKIADTIGEAIAKHLAAQSAPSRPSDTEAKSAPRQDAPDVGKGLLEKLSPKTWFDAGLRLADYVEKQEKAGKAVDNFTRALALASRFLYGFTTGRVIMPSGRRLPWRRAAAIALRRVRSLKPVRSLLTMPDRILRRTSRQMAKSGAVQRVVLRPLSEKPSSTVPALTRAIRGESVSTVTAAGVQGLEKTGEAVAKAAAVGAAGAGTAGAGAGGAAAGGGGAAAGGAAAGGTSATVLGALAAAGPVGIVIGALVALAAAVVMAAAAVRKFTVGVKEQAENLLHQRFAKYGAMSPSIAYSEARIEAYELGSKIRYAHATAQTTAQLTQAFIRLREEMEPMNRAIINIQNIAATILVHVARGVNFLLKLMPIVPILEWIAKQLAGEPPSMDIPAESLLRGLEGLQGQRPRNPPPQGGLPPWQ